MSNNVSKMGSKIGGPKLVKNGEKCPAKIGNWDFWVLHHRMITTLTFLMNFAEIEPIIEKLLAGKEKFAPP